MKDTIKRLLFCFLLSLIVLGTFACTQDDPLIDDLYTRNVYPAVNNSWTVGRLGLQYDGGYFRQIFINGVLLVPGAEVDPVFTASPAFGITALDIATWTNHPGLTTGTHGVAGTIVGTSDAQSLTNKNITMNNNTPIFWKTLAGAPQDTINLLASDILTITNASGAIQLRGGAINLNPGINEEIYLWGNGIGTGRELVLYSNNATAIGTLQDSPTINVASSYWDGGAGVGWSYKIYQDMLAAGLAPKSQAIHSINNLNVLRLENNNGTVKVYSDGTLDMTNHNIADTLKLNMTDPTELTINAGAITVTQGYHTVDTEGDAATDDLVTINGGAIGDILTLAPVSDTRSVRILSTGNVRFSEDDVTEGFSFISPTGTSGRYYAGGYYFASVADANLTQAATTVAWGAANAAYGAHVFLVSKQAGTTDAGTVSIVLSGTSINDAGTRTAADSETLIANITTMGVNSYYESTKRWIGIVTYTLTGAGGATTYAADFNYGFAKYDQFNAKHSHITGFEVVGRAGANDAGFNIRLLFHSSVGWTYSAAAFVPGGTSLCSMATDYNTEKNIVINERFSYERTNLSQEIDGDDSEGFIVEITTSANKAVEMMNATVYGHELKNQINLDELGQAASFIYNGTTWMET